MKKYLLPLLVISLPLLAADSKFRKFRVTRLEKSGISASELCKSTPAPTNKKLEDRVQIISLQDAQRAQENLGKPSLVESTKTPSYIGNAFDESQFPSLAMGVINKKQQSKQG